MAIFLIHNDDEKDKTAPQNRKNSRRGSGVIDGFAPIIVLVSIIIISAISQPCLFSNIDGIHTVVIHCPEIKIIELEGN